MADDVGVYNVSASGFRAVTGSSDASGSLNVRRSRQRALYDKLLKGEALRSQVGETYQSSTEFATPPSWTQRAIGKGHAYVISELSSSRHETFALNTFDSGSVPLETSAVPASASLYYEKSRRFRRLVYTVTSSAGLTFSPAAETAPYSGEISGRSGFVAVSGTYVNNSWYAPGKIVIDVPDYGKIRDVRVWVELVHDVRSKSFALSSTANGLQKLVLTLRSPNVKFKAGFPIWNDPKNASYQHRYNQTYLSGANNVFGSFYHDVPEAFRNAYVLWYGHRQFVGAEVNVDDVDVLNGHMSWNTDKDMRTVFCDEGEALPPSRLDPITAFNPTRAKGSVTMLSSSSPSSYVFLVCPQSIVNSPSEIDARGLHVPWFLDTRISSASIFYSELLLAAMTTSLGGKSSNMSPPPGWLSGQGGVASSGQFATTGSNLGPERIRPMYPILDDIYEWKAVDIPFLDPTRSLSQQAPTGSIGFRPGLRGTEIHGRWEFMISTFATASFSGSTFQGFQAEDEAGVWFRQVRLEFLVDQGSGVEFTYPSRLRNFSKSGFVPTKPGKVLVGVVSGTTQWNTDVNFIYYEQPQEYGRSYGITQSTGSNVQDFAVFSQITGALLSSVTGSDQANMLRSYLNNEFGTPYIPLSSGSGIGPSFFAFDTDDVVAARRLRGEVMDPRTLIKPAQNLRAVLNRTRFVRSARDQVVDRLAALATYGNASGSTVPL